MATAYNPADPTAFLKLGPNDPRNVRFLSPVVPFEDDPRMWTHTLVGRTYRDNLDGIGKELRMVLDKLERGGHGFRPGDYQDKYGYTQPGMVPVSGPWLTSLLEHLANLDRCVYDVAMHVLSQGHQIGVEDGRGAGYTEGYQHGYKDAEEDLTEDDD